MLTVNDVVKVYDTILSIPGMNDTIKIDIKMSRRNVLLLYAAIERGLLNEEDDKYNRLLKSVPVETTDDLISVAKDFLQKAGLTELNEKLRTL
jgi:hypothetical protein